MGCELYPVLFRIFGIFLTLQSPLDVLGSDKSFIARKISAFTTSVYYLILRGFVWILEEKLFTKKSPHGVA